MLRGSPEGVTLTLANVFPDTATIRSMAEDWKNGSFLQIKNIQKLNGLEMIILSS